MQLGDKIRRTFFIDTTLPISFQVEQWRDFKAEVESLLEEVRVLQLGSPHGMSQLGG